MSPVHHVSLVVIALLVLTGCDQQQPIAAQPPPTPGVKPGETPPVEPHQGSDRDGGGTPLPPATAPTTPGVPNHPAAPPLVPPPTTSPTEAPTAALVPADTRAAPSQPPGTPPLTTVPQRDTQITSAVYRAISSQPALSIDGTLITISTRDGNVTLNGTVASDVERDHLAVLAAQVDGVRSVDNRLAVSGP